MIRYTPQAQLTLKGFETLFSQHLNKENRWLKLAHSIPWDKLANIYYRKMNSDFGAPSLSARMVIGAVIIKHMLNIDDREVVAQIQENMYLQYFVGLSGFTTAEPFDPSLMISIRYRLGQDVMEEFNQLVLQQAGVMPRRWGVQTLEWFAEKLNPKIKGWITTTLHLPDTFYDTF